MTKEAIWPVVSMLVSATQSKCSESIELQYIQTFFKCNESFGFQFPLHPTLRLRLENKKPYQYHLLSEKNVPLFSL